MPADGVVEPLLNGSPWTCAECGKTYVVQSMARLCEMRDRQNAETD